MARALMDHLVVQQGTGDPITDDVARSHRPRDAGSDRLCQRSILPRSTMRALARAIAQKANVVSKLSDE